MTEEAQVIQADRDAAAELHLLRYGDPHPYGDILCGELDDGDFVQAFARHRIAAEREVTERAAKLGEPLITPSEPAQLSADLNQTDREKLVRAVVERCVEVAEAIGGGMTTKGYLGQGAMAAAAAIRSLNIDDLVKETGE